MDTRFHNKIKISYTQQYKLELLTRYIIRDTPCKYDRMSDESIHLTTPFGYSDPRYENTTFSSTANDTWIYYDVPMFVYFVLPRFIDLGKVTLTLGDINTMIDMFFEAYQKLTENEEISEKATNYEQETAGI